MRFGWSARWHILLTVLPAVFVLSAFGAAFAQVEIGSEAETAATAEEPAALTAPAPGPSEPAAPERPSVQGILTGNSVNVRKGPGTEYPIYFQAPVGYQVQVVGRRGIWLEIEFPGAGFSWVTKEYLQKIDEETGIMIASAVNVRSGPGTQYDVLYKVPIGHKFAILGVDPITGNWYKVTPMPGETAWIRGDYVKLSGPVPGSTTEVPPPTTTGVPGAPGPTPPATAPPKPAVPADVYDEKLTKAEELFKAETSKDNPADWDLDTLRKMYAEIEKDSTSPMAKIKATSRLRYLATYEALKARSVEIGKIDENLQSRLRELEQQRQLEMTAAITAVTEKSPYVAAGALEKFYIQGLGGATHKLLENGKIAYLLRSEAIDLKAHEGKTVGVRGKFVITPGQNVKVIEVSSVVPLSKE